MSINITAPLKSQPQSIPAGRTAQLLVGLTTNRSPSETAQIRYRVNAPGVVFANNGTQVLQTTEQVFSTGTTSITPYSLSGPPGAVPIQVEVTPATPPAKSGTSVVLTSAGALAGATVGFAPDGPPGVGDATGRQREPDRPMPRAGSARARKSGARTVPARKAGRRKTSTRKAVRTAKSKAPKATRPTSARKGGRKRSAAGPRSRKRR